VSVAGRATVVFETMSPSIRRMSAVATMSSRPRASRSGAILSMSGRRGSVASRASTTRAIRSSSASRRCKSRKPGVFGEETLIVR